MHQLPLPIHGHQPLSFDTFVPGPNAWALAQLSELALGNDPASEPIYLWGPAGCGKTHLLQSLAASFRGAGRVVGWYDDTTDLPWPIDEACALTVFDNCQAFGADHQQAAFALFADASARGGRVAAAGRMPPVDLPLREDLRSRLGWGHVIALQPLSDGEVAQVLGAEAARRGLVLSDDVRAYVLTHLSRDLGSLMTLLEQADAFALSQKRPLTVPLLRQVLAGGAQAGSVA